MPSIIDESLAFGESALLVAAVAVPVGLACRFASRKQVPALPAYRKGYSRWLGIDVAVMAFTCLVFRDAIAGALEPLGAFAFLAPDGPVDELRFQLQYQRSTLVGLASLPLFAFAFHAWKSRSAAERPNPRFAADVAAGIFGWLVIAPATFAVHFAVIAILQYLEIAPDEHPLKNRKLKSALDVALFVAGACVVAPVFEEMGYRRIIVPWSARRVERSWIVMAFAAFASVAFATGSSRWGPRAVVLTMAGSMLAMGILSRYRPRFPVRPASALVATATLFGVIHSGVWPTPVPLVVLGLGLGWLVLRTKTATAAIVAHGLFNAISAVQMLRGGP